MGFECFQSCDRIAKKQHICIWCGEKIEIGAEYHYVVGKFQGDFQDNNFHPECNKAAQSCFSEDPEEGFEPCAYERGSLESRAI